VLGNAEGMKNLTEAAKPIEGLLMMVFFLSVGLLIDFNFIWEHLGQVILWLAVVTVVKTILNILLFRVCGQPWPRAFLAGVLLGQVGEFSFLLAAVGTDAGIMPVTENDLVVAVVALSLLISPLWLAAARRLQEVAARRRRTFRSLLSYLLGIDLGAAFAGTGRRIGTAFKATARASGGAVAGLGNLVPGRNRRATPMRRKRRQAAAEARPSEHEIDKADDA
jgi:CPA2 family monovalent cation:H+ antiporter-2